MHNDSHFHFLNIHNFEKVHSFSENKPSKGLKREKQGDNSFCISQINVFKTKFKLKCQNDFFGILFVKSGNTYAMFSLLRLIWRTFDMIIDVQYLTLLKDSALDSL